MSEGRQSRLQLAEALTHFEACGLNDERRVDLTRGRPFLAVDDTKTVGVDDAFRVNRRNSGFDVEVAAADASQLLGHPTIVSCITDRYSSLYRTGKTAMTLPRPIVLALGLQAGKRQRALVIRQSFDRQGGRRGNPVLIPALIRAGRTTPEILAQTVLKNPRHPLLTGAYLIEKRQPRKPTDVADPARLRRLGSELVATYTTFANRLAAQWAGNEYVPVLCQRHAHLGMTAIEPYYAYSGTDTATEQPHYAQITSALRRGIDAINHMNLGHHLAHKSPVFDSEMLDRVAMNFNAPNVA